MCGHDTDAMQLFHEEPTGYTEGREDSGHPDGAEEVQRPRKITQQKADGNQVEENPYSARKSVMGSATFAVHIANRDFDDRGAVPRCQRRNETMQFTVERNLFQNVAAVGLEGRAKIVDIDTAQFSHQPVSTEGRDAAQPEIIDAALAPSTDDIVAFGDFFQEYRDIGRVVLQIAVHGDDVLAAGMIKSGGQSGGLAKIQAQLDDRDTAIHGSDFAQQLESPVTGAIVHEDEFEGLRVSLHYRFETVVEIHNIFLLVMERHHDGVLWHGNIIRRERGAELPGRTR